MKTRNRALVIVTLSMLGIALTAPASAQEAAPTSTEPTGILRVGKLYSFGGGTDLQHGFGMDLRYQLYPERNMDGYVGVFGQSQYELGDAWRFDGGVTGGWGFFGLEVGISHRTATATYAGSTGLHIGQSITFGPVSIGGRLTIPLVDDIPQNVAVPPSVQGVEGALTITLGWGFTVHGERRASGCHGMHGH